MQKAPRGKLKLEFDHVWDFHKREVQRLTADGGRLFPGTLGKPLVWARSSKYKANSSKLAFHYGWLIWKSWAGFSWLFDVCNIHWFQLELVHAPLFQKCWSSCCAIIAEHNNLRASLGSLPLSSSLSLALSLRCNALRTGLSLVYRNWSDKDPGCAWCF